MTVFYTCSVTRGYSDGGDLALEQMVRVNGNLARDRGADCFTAILSVPQRQGNLSPAEQKISPGLYILMNAFTLQNKE